MSIRSDGRRLSGNLFRTVEATEARPGLLFIHGHKSSQSGYQSRARSTAEALSAICLTFDLSGHGEDAANFNRYGTAEHLADVIAAYDYLVSQPSTDAGRIGICGASYGGFLAPLLTSRRTVKRLLLRAPSLGRDLNAGSSQKARPGKEFDSLQALAGYPGEVLIVESEHDEVIPHSYIVSYLAASRRGSHRVIPGATHALTDPAWDDFFVNLIITWFRDL